MVRHRQPTGESDPRLILRKLHGLQTELVELAFTLDRRGRPEAAEVAITLSGRLGELCEELDGAAAECKADGGDRCLRP